VAYHDRPEFALSLWYAGPDITTPNDDQQLEVVSEQVALADGVLPFALTPELVAPFSDGSYFFFRADFMDKSHHAVTGMFQVSRSKLTFTSPATNDIYDPAEPTSRWKTRPGRQSDSSQTTHSSW
jgi:hypothetical protein